MKAKLPSSILNETDLPLKQCKTEFSDFISSHFANELQQSKEYESFATNDGAGHALWKVNRKGHSQKHRVVSLEERTGLLHCSCYTTSNTGAPCRHILHMLHVEEKPLYNSLYFHPRWKRVFNFCEGEELLAELVSGQLDVIEKTYSRPTKENALFDNVDDIQEVESQHFEVSNNDANTHQPPKKSKMEQNYAALIAESQLLASAASHNPDVTSAVLIALKHLRMQIRNGVVPKICSNEAKLANYNVFEDASGCVTTDLSPTVVADPITTTGARKRKRIASTGECSMVKKCGRRTVKGKNRGVLVPNAPHSCSVCGGQLCTVRNCALIAQFGRLVKKEQYPLLLAVTGNSTTNVAEKDFTRAPFDKNWRIVILEFICKDKNGAQYCAIQALDKDFNRININVLYTHVAFELWLTTKSKQKHLVVKSAIDESLLSVPSVKLRIGKRATELESALSTQNAKENNQNIGNTADLNKNFLLEV